MAKQILILGGGYGGLLTALTARKHLTSSEANITIINKFSTHQIITELHRLAGGTIKEQAVALPLQKLLGDKNVNVVVDTIKEIKPNENKSLQAAALYIRTMRWLLPLAAKRITLVFLVWKRTALF